MIAQMLASLISNKMLFSTSPVFHADSLKVLPVLKTMQLNPLILTVDSADFNRKILTAD